MMAPPPLLLEELDELLELDDDEELELLLDDELELDDVEDELLLLVLLDELDELELLLDEELELDELEDELPPPLIVIRALPKVEPELIREASARKGKTGAVPLMENKKPFL